MLYLSQFSLPLTGLKFSMIQLHAEGRLPRHYDYLKAAKRKLTQRFGKVAEGVIPEDNPIVVGEEGVF
tara:strand:- start:720 stop:923 length:204 start_codon:yes stop_codon:yes gene_type:complete